MSKIFSKIYIEITNNCNLNCSFCSIDTLPKKEMTSDEFKIVIEKIKNYTKSIYLHVKGEPLLHKDLDEILTICDDNNIVVNITTNGTLLDRRLEVLKKHRINKINVSLHSENRDKDYFEKVFASCDILLPKITIIYRIWTLSTLDLDKVSTIIVDKIKKHYNLSKEDLERIKKEKNIKIGNRLYIDKDYEFSWPTISNSKNNIGTCLGTRTHIAILSNGDVVPCCLDSNGIIKLGNIFEEEMDDIINSKLFISINEGFRKQKIICDLCKCCTYRNRFMQKQELSDKTKI